MEWIGNTLIFLGLVILAFFGYRLFKQNQHQSVTIGEVEAALEEQRINNEEEFDLFSFQPEQHEAFGILHVPKLERSIGIVEGTDPDALDKGVGHVSSTVFPGQEEQIVLSGHRDTVFRNFEELEIGDRFIVEMPYGEYEYEVRDTEIVDADDTSVIRKMGEEVLVVTTCYPFNMLGSAPQRFVFYAYPVE